MSAQQFLSALSQGIFLALFVVAAVRVVRRPGWVSFDTFLFFAVIAALLLVGDLARLFGLTGEAWPGWVAWVGLTALPYILLRLVDAFRPQHTALMVAAGTLFVAVSVLGVLSPQPWSPAVSLVPVAYVVALGGYASVAFLQEALRTTGVSRRRMQAVALGSGLLAAVILLAGVAVVFPGLREAIGIVNQVLSLVLVLSYFIGFAPPPILRRAWQEPVLRAVIADAPELVRVTDVAEIAARIELQARDVTGAEGAGLGLWDEAGGVLRFNQHPVGFLTMKPGEYISGRAFEQQRAIYTIRAGRDAPEHADDYQEAGIQALVSVPVTSGERRLGVLTVYAARPPAFTDDAVALVELLAEQAALVLRSHQLLQEAAQVRALAEVTRLKDDFLSVVAHDVRTPLTTVLLNAELLQRSLPEDDQNARRAAALRTEALRLKQLVEDYLDVVRAEHGREPRFEDHDLVVLVREALAGMDRAVGRVRLSGEPSVRGTFDAGRVEQLVQNLVSNALNYSDAGSPVEVVVSVDGAVALLSVTDHGIGIPESDIGLLFERFHRGSNADDRRYAGLGLGLYICRQIAREHGGDIDVVSSVGEGTTFTVRLARSAGEQPMEPESLPAPHRTLPAAGEATS